MICVHMVVITTTTITDSRYKAAQAYGAAEGCANQGMDRGCLLSPDAYPWQLHHASLIRKGQPSRNMGGVLHLRQIDAAKERPISSAIR